MGGAQRPWRGQEGCRRGKSPPPRRDPGWWVGGWWMGWGAAAGWGAGASPEFRVFAWFRKKLQAADEVIGLKIKRWRHLKPIPVNELTQQRGAPGKGGDGLRRAGQGRAGRGAVGGGRGARPPMPRRKARPGPAPSWCTPIRLSLCGPAGSVEAVRGGAPGRPEEADLSLASSFFHAPDRSPNPPSRSPNPCPGNR